MKRGLVVLGVVFGALLFISPAANAQTLYGIGFNCSLWEFTTAPGGPCLAPNPMRTLCNYCVASPCPPPYAGPLTDELLGDVAVDCLKDTVWVTDGRVLQEYVGDRPCGTPPPCTPLDSFVNPLAPVMGPLTGLGMDETGALTGVPTLWITDGFLIAGISPTGCGAAVVCGPIPVALPVGSVLTDLTWDPNPTPVGPGSLWACDSAGFVHNIVVTCAPPAPSATIVFSFMPPSCGLTAPLTGIAFDLATPGVRSTRAQLYVTDGFVVEYVEVSGGPAAPQFYTPVLCTPTNDYLTGLAYATHGITYGTPRVSARIGSYGQSCSPGPTFGLEWIGEPPGTTSVILVANFQIPGPGFACPPIPALGTSFWVDITRPSLTTVFLPPFALPCVPVPAAIPPGFAAPPGLKVFCQFIFRGMAGGSPVTLDATEGLAFTITAP